MVAQRLKITTDFYGIKTSYLNYFAVNSLLGVKIRVINTGEYRPEQSLSIT
jgi:hypothetical protein